MNYLGWLIAIVMGVLYMRTSTVNDSKILAYEKTLRTIEDTVTLKQEVFNEISNRYEKCLNREKRLNGLWRRKVGNYRQLVKLNKQRIEEWQRKEKPLIQAHFSQAFRSLAGLEKLTIPYKLAYLTYLEPTKVSPLVLRLSQ